MTLRSARSDDLDAIGELQTRSILALGIAAYDEETCVAWARLGRQVRHTLLNDGRLFVAERQALLVGVAGWVADSREADSAWSRYVFVDPAHAGCSIGHTLMTTVERSVSTAGRSRIQLWSSLNALGFYRSLGYRPIKTARWPITAGIEMAHMLMEKRLVQASSPPRW